MEQAFKMFLPWLVLLRLNTRMGLKLVESYTEYQHRLLISTRDVLRSFSHQLFPFQGFEISTWIA